MPPPIHMVTHTRLAPRRLHSIRHGQTQELEHLGNGEDGANAHFVGLTTGHGKTQEATQRLQVSLLSQLFDHDHHSAAAVRQQAGVTRHSPWPQRYPHADNTKEILKLGSCWGPLDILKAIDSLKAIPTIKTITSLPRRTLQVGALLLTLVDVHAAIARPHIEVWKSPTCGCYKDWVAHLQANGYPVTIHEVGEPAKAAQRTKLGMPEK